MKEYAPPKPRTVKNISWNEQFVVDLLGGAWTSHSGRRTDRSGETLNKAGEIHTEVIG